MHGVVLLKGHGVFILSHMYHDGTNPSEQRVICTFVCLPCGDKIRQAVMEGLLINLNFFRHVDGDALEHSRLTKEDIRNKDGVRLR